MDQRKIFDTIPEMFDKWRPRYCKEVFDYIINEAKLDITKDVLEIGPGTGQATEPILLSGCKYMAIELGEHLTDFMSKKFSTYSNFHIVNGDFETYDFAKQKFDLIYSAATIQWIPEEIAFSKTYNLLKSGRTLAMMFTRSEYKSSNENLYHKIQEVYSEYFRTEHPYTQKMNYQNVVNYGFTNFQCKEFQSKRVLTSDEYVAYCSTHCDHIALKEPYREKFFEGLRKAVLEHGNEIVIHDTIILYLVKKP